MAEATGKITFDFEPFVKLQCGNQDCVHNLYFDCNLKHIHIGSNGQCTNMKLKEKKEAKTDESKK